MPRVGATRTESAAGYHIGPFEVEDALVTHEAVAVGSPHQDRDSVVSGEGLRPLRGEPRTE